MADISAGTPQISAACSGVKLLHNLSEGFEVFGLLVDKVLILPAVFQNHVHHPVQQCHIGAHFLVDVNIGNLGDVDFTRIGNDDFGPVFLWPERFGWQSADGKRWCWIR